MEILFYFRSKEAMDDCFDYCNLPLALWDELNIHRKSLGPEYRNRIVKMMRATKSFR